MCAARSANRAAEGRDSPGADSLLDRIGGLPPGCRLTRERTVSQLCDDVLAFAGRLRVAPGEAIGLRLPSGEDWIIALLGLLRAGASPLLAAPDAPAKEFDRLLSAAGGRRELVFDGTFSLTGEPADGGPRGVLLATSGSTGEPTLVLRDEPSLIAEGLRYEEAVGLDGSDRLVLPLPLTHAYALGWLAAALITGTEIRPHPPSAMSAIAGELAGGATIIALVPTLARLLVLRQRRRPVEAPTLRLAMIGAGAVDERLEREFQAAFGVSTGRNYGSTETGALFAGLADLPPLCVGAPMPGVEFRIIKADAAGVDEGAGLLEVRLSGAEQWRQTSDIAVYDGDGRVRVLGRRYGAIRKGGRWIAPLEVEAVLREHPAVRDAHVRAQRGRFADEDALIADVAADDGLEEAELLLFAGERLSAYKVPDRLHLRRILPRNSVGKAGCRPWRYRFADAGVLIAALRAYRRSELLFALAELGLIESLRTGADVDELADAHGLPAEQLQWLLTIAVDLGLLRTDDGAEAAVPGLTALIGLEGRLSRSWLDRRAIAGAVAAGRAVRPFDVADLDPGLPVAYQRAMHGPHTASRTRLGLRLLGDRAQGRVLEVSAGPGRYLDALLDRYPATTGAHLTQLGRLPGPLLSRVDSAMAEGRVALDEDPPAGAFDACVVANGVHGPGRGDDLAWLLDRLVPGGALLIDDIFLPAEGGPGTEIGLDWLTHGGTSWPRLAELEAGFEAAGGTVARTVRLDPPECCLILVKEGQ